MKKFQNLTTDGNEKSVKIGKNVPTQGAGISWFSSLKVNPRNNISIVDISGSIQENRITNEDGLKATIAFADELGFLKKVDGSYDFPSNDVTVGNIFLNKATGTEKIDISEPDASGFVHYMYISRYFISGPANMSLISLKQYVPFESIKDLNIKVLDANNNEYIDSLTNIKKYRILLEPFKTLSNYSGNEWPYRIIVLFDSDEPINLKLVYDKVECDDNANAFNLNVNYVETVNAIPYFYEVPEESFVIDDNYKDKNNFSIKKIDDKYRTLISEVNKQNGYQIIVPSKAIKDYRTFEVFNWRTITRTRNNINFDQVNYGSELDSSGTIIQKTVNVGVLYSSVTQVTNSSINPYIFGRLQNSPFNLAKYTFVNPSATSIDKTLASYWKVDIDTIDDLSNFDVLAWSPSTVVTANQNAKLQEFLRKNGTLILDMNDGGCDARSLNTQLSVSSTTTSSSYIDTVNTNVLLDNTKNGGWSIQDGIFEKDYYGIYGSNYSYRGNTYKNYRYFNNTTATNSFLNVGTSSASAQSAGVVLAYPNSGDSLSRGNIVGTTFPLMPYCNAIYNINSPEQVANSNYGDTSADPSGTTLYSGIVEGPFKLLYNIVSYALYCRSQATRSIDIRSSLYNFITQWDSSWTMDGDALFDDEKEQYFTQISINNLESKYVRNIINNNNSMFDFYKSSLSRSLSNFLPPAQRETIQNLSSSNVEIFIEVTNPDVIISNATVVDTNTNTNGENIPSSYYLFKVTDPNIKCYAYTNKVSPKLTVPSDFGAYAIIDSQHSTSGTLRLNNQLNVLNSFRSYPFNLTSKYNYARAVDKPLSLDVTLSTSLSVTFNATLKEVRTVTTNPTKASGESVSTGALCISIKSAIDDLGLLPTTSTSNANNVFPYTGDIDIHLDTRIWSYDEGPPVKTPTGEYVKYIQYTLSVHGSYKSTVDGVYGSKTRQAVRDFQEEYKARYIDGKVDSETKSYLALFWKNNENFDNWILWAEATRVPEVVKYMRAARSTVLASDIGNATYRKITFTGFGGPSEAKDIIFFEIDTSKLKIVNSIFIEADDNVLWRNFSIDAYGWSSSYTTDILASNLTFLNASALNNNIEITMNGRLASECRYMWISVTGKSIPYYGSGEGFGIKAIEAQGTTIKEESPGSDPVSETIISTRNTLVTATVSSVETHNNITSALDASKTYTTSNINRSTSFISAIEYSDQGPKIINFDDDRYKLSDNIDRTFDNLTINFASAPTSVALNSAAITQVNSSGRAVIGSPITLTTSGNLYNLTTSAVYYSGSQIFNISNSLSTGYKLRTIDGRIFSDSRNSVDVNDGILLLCNQSGSPYGLPTSAEINTELTGISSINSEEIDLRYGSFIVKNEIENQDGFIYGFYDILQKEFLGHTITYIDIISRGVGNIFIGVCAIDADGNTQNKNEYIGPTVNTTFKPVNVPLKTIVPVYSVKTNSNSAIKVGKMNDNLSKFNAWPLPLTTGSFWKKVSISSDYKWTGWKANYINQDLNAEYTTINEFESPSSELFGFGHQDVLNESPLILSSNKIQVSNTPILAWNHPTNNRNSIVGIIKPEIKIYTRESISSEWVQITYSAIRDIDCYNGLIEFNKNIIPQDPELIKVNYTTVNKDVLLNHINGVPIPLNPVLNSNNVYYNQPLYIYILPKNIYKKENIQNNTNNLIKIDDYSFLRELIGNNSPVQFTYDSSIFDNRSSQYDPFALPIATIYVTNNPYSVAPDTVDLRLKGGGIAVDKTNYELMEAIPEVLSFWDVYSPSGKAYNKGGYVIIRIPKEVKDYFVDQKEIYNIISNNLTAGIAYELQDMDGNSWN
jgi:peptidoglycan hydrolase-like protein with peptidoglycan-binding domain